MLCTFANHLALVRNAWGKWGSCVLGLDEAMAPAKLAEMLVFSFLEDIWFTLTSTVLPVELRSVGNLRRIEGGRIHFSPDIHLDYEAKGEAGRGQLLLDGVFWQVLCRVDTKEKMFFVPPRRNSKNIYATAHLREVAECMLKVIQHHNLYFYDVSLDTLFGGLCLTIHDAICGSAGFYLERIGTFFHHGHFEPDRMLLKKIRAKNSTEVFENVQCSSGFPGSRRRNNNQAWYWRLNG